MKKTLEVALLLFAVFGYVTCISTDNIVDYRTGRLMAFKTQFMNNYYFFHKEDRHPGE